MTHRTVRALYLAAATALGLLAGGCVSGGAIASALGQGLAPLFGTSLSLVDASDAGGTKLQPAQLLFGVADPQAAVSMEPQGNSVYHVKLYRTGGGETTTVPARLSIAGTTVTLTTSTAGDAVRVVSAQFEAKEPGSVWTWSSATPAFAGHGTIPAGTVLRWRSSTLLGSLRQ